MLTGAGYIPIAGIWASIIETGINLSQGDIGGACSSAMGLLPGGKVLGDLGKYVSKVTKGGQTLHREAEAARDAMAAELEKSKHPPATVVGGYSPSTGRVGAEAGKGGGHGCAENSCAQALGNPADIQFTKAIRPRTGRDIPVCTNCENNFGRGVFPDPKTKVQNLYDNENFRRY